MIRIIKSGFSPLGRDRIIEEIRDHITNGTRAFLIVPEQQTVMAEGLASRALPPDSVLSFEATNFTRLTNTAERTLGGLSGEYSDKAKKSLVMWRALTELSPLLTELSGRREVSFGLVERNLSAVLEMQSLGIHPDELSLAAENSKIKSDGRLSAKIKDLSLVYSLYKKLLSEKYSDTADDGEKLVKLLTDNPNYLSDTKIFIEGFTSFTEPQYKIIDILSARTDVTLVLTLPTGREGAFEFSEIRECEKRIASSARNAETRVFVDTVDDNEKTEGALGKICANFWVANCDNVNVTLQNNEVLRVFEAGNPFEECEFVASDIKRRVRDGASYRDFAIVARSADKYSGILDSALSRAKIPAFTSSKRDVGEFDAVKLIYTAYAAVRGFAREDVITYSKCPASGISREESDEFEMYVNKWQINGKRFTDDVIWNMNPEGYTTRRDGETDRKLLRIHQIRERIVGPLKRFAKAVEGVGTVSSHARCLLDFLLEIDMEKSILKRAEALERAGERAYAEENRSLWSAICRSLDTVVEVLGDAPCDAEAFVAQLKVVFSSLDVGRIPAYVDEVTVGSADMLRLFGKPHVYMIGVNSGEFPASVSDSSYFSEHDKAVISGAGVGLDISPTLEKKSARELYIFSRAFSYASESVTLSYSIADTRFKAVSRSAVIDRICAITGTKVNKLSAVPYEEKLYSAELALTDMGGYGELYPTVRDALVRSGYGGDVEISERDMRIKDCKVEGEALSEISPEIMRLSQTKIDSFVKCPFSYFCKYELSLSSDEVAEFDARSIGSFIHSILENFFVKVKREGIDIKALSDEDRSRLTRASAEEYISALGEEVSRVSTKVKLDRLCRAAEPVVEGLCEEFSTSEFVPAFFELSLSDRDPDAPSTLKFSTSDNKKVVIGGTIDRVDVYRDGNDFFLRVVDYKTGSKVFSPDDMKAGRNLQMFLYLRALVDSNDEGFKDVLANGERADVESKTPPRVGEERLLPEDVRLHPAGVVYFKTPVSDKTVALPSDALAREAVKAEQAREGMVLDDGKVLSAMGLEYTPVYNKKKPNEINEAKRKYLFDEAGWQDISDTVETSVKTVAERICRGEFPAIPDTEGAGYSPCVYCEFKPICRKAEI